MPLDDILNAASEAIRQTAKRIYSDRVYQVEVVHRLVSGIQLRSTGGDNLTTQSANGVEAKDMTNLTERIQHSR